jgi:hypothetical protein
VTNTRSVSKRRLDVGMRLDVSRRAVWNEYAQREVDVSELFVSRLIHNYGRNVRGNNVLSSTTTWDSSGNRVVWYHHFDQRIRLV